ncbi:MAG: molybdenum cofactor biosynthesis enzyme MoaA [Clostridium sp.]
MITKRMVLHVGYACNARCSFCYYLEQIESGNTNDLSTEEIKQRLKQGRQWGKTAIDFTGGEPTIRKDLVEVISYAKEIGYKDINVITNCIIIARKEHYLQELVDAGLNDILLSLHSFSPELHDHLTKILKSHHAVLKTAEKVNSIDGLSLRFNYVVNQENFHELNQAVDLMASYKPDAINLILFHPNNDAITADQKVKFNSYGVITTEVKKAIDAINDKVPHINVRHLPYCLMKGYERHLKPFFQLQYEKKEWDYCLSTLQKRGKLVYWAGLAGGAFLSLTNPYFWVANWDNKKHLAIQRVQLLTMRKKGNKCSSCALNHICDGLQKEYIKKYGDDELKPYIGDTIYNPTYFMPRDEIEC